MRGRARFSRDRQRGGVSDAPSTITDIATEPALRGAAPRVTPEESSAATQHRRARRVEDRVAPQMRSAGVLEAPEFEFRPDPGLTPMERKEAIDALRAKGHRVRVIEP